MSKDKSLLTHLHKIVRTRQVRFQSGDSHYTITERTDMGGPVTKNEHYSPEGDWPVPTPETTTQRKNKMSGNGIDPNEGNPYLAACLIGMGIFLCVILLLMLALLQSGGG